MCRHCRERRYFEKTRIGARIDHSRERQSRSVTTAGRGNGARSAQSALQVEEDEHVRNIAQIWAMRVPPDPMHGLMDWSSYIMAARGSEFSESSRLVAQLLSNLFIAMGCPSRIRRLLLSNWPLILHLGTCRRRSVCPVPRAGSQSGRQLVQAEGRQQRRGCRSARRGTLPWPIADDQPGRSVPGLIQNGLKITAVRCGCRILGDVPLKRARTE